MKNSHRTDPALSVTVRFDRRALQKHFGCVPHHLAAGSDRLAARFDAAVHLRTVTVSRARFCLGLKEVEK